MLTKIKSWLRPPPPDLKELREADKARIIRARGLEAVKRELEK